jgi:hypothetical protein
VHRVGRCTAGSPAGLTAASPFLIPNFLAAKVIVAVPDSKATSGH